MRLDHCWFSAKSAFYNVRINRSLCKEFYCTDLLCFFFKNTDKFFSDNFTLCFRFCNSGKLVVVSFLCIDTDKVQVKLTIRSKYCLNFIAFILTKKTVIYKYAGKLFADCSGKQSCCHRGINSAWKRKKYSSVPNFFTDFLDGIFNKCIHLPFADTSTDILYKVVDHLGSFRCMKHFRMELDCIKLFCCIFCCCYRTVCCVCSNLKSRCHLRNIIKMAHPAGCCCRYIFKYFRIFLIDDDFCLTIFSDVSFFNFSAKYVRHKLCTITKTKYRNAKLKEFFRISRWIRFVTAIRSSCQDNSLRVHCFNLFDINLIRINFAIYITFPDTSCDKLVILSTKVKYNH